MSKTISRKKLIKLQKRQHDSPEAMEEYSIKLEEYRKSMKQFLDPEFELCLFVNSLCEIDSQLENCIEEADYKELEKQALYLMFIALEDITKIGFRILTKM